MSAPRKVLDTCRDMEVKERFGIGARCAVMDCTHVPSTARMVQYEVAGRKETMFYYYCADHDPRKETNHA